jgi:[acyl-carrier-protein] S-malonyltransferase
MKTAFLFPGQGAQTVGMAADIAASCTDAARIFERANDILGYDLKDICFNGSDEKLNATTISQPAIFTVSAAILEVLRSSDATAAIKPDITAGLSLGEYTALYAAGLLSFEDTLNLVQKRGNAMQAAADASDGSMVSIIGLDEEKVNKLCLEAGQGDLLAGANFNCPGQIVITGTSRACRRAEQLAEKHGAMKAVVLKVAGAFHSEMMTPAAKTLRAALGNCQIADITATKVIANITADYYSGPDQIRDGLTRQLTEPILWQKCMEKLLADGVEKFYEIGPGRVLTGLMRRINRKTRVTNISSLKSLQELQAVVSV